MLAAMLFRMATLLFALFWGAQPLLGQTDAPASQDRSQKIEVLRKMIAWDTLARAANATSQNPHRLTWEFLSSDISETEHGHLLAVSASVYGAPINNPFHMIRWDLETSPVLVYEEVWLNRHGIPFRNRIPEEGQDADGGSGSIGFRLGGAKGEAHRYLLVSPDHTLAIYGTFVPFPITAHQAKCKAELRLARKDARSLELLADGMQPDSTVQLQTLSAGSLHQETLHTDAQGQILTGLLVHDGGQANGTIEITITASTCTLHFSHPWGEQSYQPQ